MFQIAAIVISLALTVVAAAAVAVAVRQMLGVIRQGQPASRSDEPARRTLTMLKETFLHTRMLQWTWVGVMHWFVFAAFLFLSTAVAAAYFQLFKPDFAWPIVGHWYPYEWFSEIIGLLSTIGIIVLIIYRQTHHPRSLGRKSRFFGSNFWQAYFVEFLALFEGAAILFVRGAEWKLDEHAGRAHYPLASWLGDVLYPDGPDSLANIVYAVALFKIALAMIWLIVVARNLTMGIAWHRFTAWFNIWFKREATGRTALGAIKPLTSGGRAIALDDIEDLDEDATLGAGKIEDFSWKGILDFTTCTECGRCQSQCPAWNTEKPLSPKLLVMGLRDHAYAKANGNGDGAAERSLVGKADEGEWFYNPEGGDFVIDEDVLWSCTSCGACVQQCPVDIEHVDHIMDMRRYQVLVESNFPSELNQLFKGLENKGNPWNMSPNARMDWAKGLDFDVKVVGEDLRSLDEVDWLFWVGCAGAYEDRAKKTTRAVAELLHHAGISFGVLGNGETCTGDPARRAGNEFVFQGLATANAETFKEFKVKKAVTTCAHCFNTLRNEYREFGVELEVVHHTQLLNKLVREGRLTPVNDGAGAHKRSITYHDPCYIGRHNGVYTPPRELLQVLPGAEYVEMPRNSERSFCCGAGGARMWMEETIGERINVNRTNEAVATGADQIAVGCPFCRVMLSDGLTAAQANGDAREEVEVLDVAQMLLASVKGEMATKLAPATALVAAGAASAGAAGTAGTPVEVKAEPEAGDPTITDDTVVATEDAGPAAKASGGTSLFDAPAEETAAPAPEDVGLSLFDTPAAAEPQAAAEPAAGGSLFDVAPEAEAPAEPAAADEAAASGGSLFDVAPTEAQEAPEKDAPAAQQTSADLGAGGSLFDVSPAQEAPQEEAPGEAPSVEPGERQQAGAETPAAETVPEPQADLGVGGSLFDIPAPAPKAPAPEPTAERQSPAEVVAAPAEMEVEQADQAMDRGGSIAPAPEPGTEREASAAPAAPGGAAASPAVAAVPRTDVDVDDLGSLFDIEAPEATPVAPATAPGAEESEPEESVSEPQTAAESVTPVTEPAVEAPQTAEPRPAQAASPAAPEAGVANAGTVSGATSVPRTDVDFDSVSSLFDIEAPETTAADTTAEATASTAEPVAEPVAESVAQPMPEPVVEQPEPADEPVTEEPSADEPAAEESVAEDAAPTASEQRAAAEQPEVSYSDEAHEPRTDVDIHEANSLFDL